MECVCAMNTATTVPGLVLRCQASSPAGTLCLPQAWKHFVKRRDSCPLILSINLRGLSGCFMRKWAI
uniref:Uncharacterized protein n=1 Tax=Parascaris equorum TaxID=6256 RepID=A0A914RL89_PAREQ